MRRITVDCTMREARKLVDFISKNPCDFPGVRPESVAETTGCQMAQRLSYPDPNRRKLSWHKIFTDSDKEECSAKLNKHRLERWVNGSPGADSGYVLVKRFVQILDGKPQPFVSMELRGDAEITEEKSKEILRLFLGEQNGKS
jgi:hypothetical protein